MPKFFLLLLFFSIVCFAQEEDPANYFPAHKGDMWEYLVWDSDYYDTLQVFTVWDSVDADGNIYITKKGRLINPFDERYYGAPVTYKIDKMLQVWTGFDFGTAVQYKLNAKQGDKWIMAEYRDGDKVTGYEMTKVDSVWDDEMFGVKVKNKLFTWYSAFDTTDDACKDYGCLERNSHILTLGFGESWWGGGDLWTNYSIKGAILNNTLFGDTTFILTSIMGKEEKLASSFILYQNYPNPFNPFTTIRYDINKTSDVNLKIYNLLGQMVKVLVDEQKLPGRYDTEFDASELSSGVYIAVLHAANKTMSVSMILMK